MRKQFKFIEARFKRYEAVVEKCNDNGSRAEILTVMKEQDILLNEYLQTKILTDAAISKATKSTAGTSFPEALPKIKIKKFKGTPYE